MTALIRADMLKLLRRRGVMIAAACVVIGIPLIALITQIVGRSVSPENFDEYGGGAGYENLLGAARFGLFVVAIMVGAVTGIQDESRGVFRDLVATGVNRIRLGFSRLPAAVLVVLPLVAVAVGLALAVGVIAPGPEPMPGAAEVLQDLALVTIELVVYTGLAVGLSALTGSLSLSLTLLYLWLLIIDPIMAEISWLGDSRRFLLSRAFLPLTRPELRFEGESTLGLGAAGAVTILSLWLMVFMAAGLWRVTTRDA